MIRLLFVLVLLIAGCAPTVNSVVVCQPPGCLPDEHFNVQQCDCVLNEDAHLE